MYSLHIYIVVCFFSIINLLPKIMYCSKNVKVEGLLVQEDHQLTRLHQKLCLSLILIQFIPELGIWRGTLILMEKYWAQGLGGILHSFSMSYRKMLLRHWKQLIWGWFFLNKFSSCLQSHLVASFKLCLSNYQ